MNAPSIFTVLLAAVALQAGVRVQMESTDLVNGKTTAQETLMDATRLRVNSDGNTSILFLTDGGRNRMLILDKQKNEYREIDQQTMDQMGQQMQGAMSQMEEMMKNMPPQQREMMEKMMKGKMPQMASARPATVYSVKGRSTVNGFACAQYEGTRAGEKVADVCTAPPSALKIAAADAQLFEKMREFTIGFQKALANSPFLSNLTASPISEAGFEGFPVQRISFRSGQATNKQELKSVNQATFTDADFSVGNAKKVEMPSMGPMGRPDRR